MGESLFHFNYCSALTSKSLAPATQSDFWFLLNITTQCQSMCTYAVGASCWAGGWRGRKCLENMADARIKQRTREKLSNLFWFFATNVLSPLKESSFYPGNLKMDFMPSLSFLSCVPICSCELWIKLKSTFATHSIPCPSIFADDVLRAPAKTSEKVGSLEGCFRAKPTPGYLGEPSSCSRFQLYFVLFPIQRVSGLVELGREVFGGLSLLHQWASAAQTWICDSWQKKTVQFSEN